MLVKLMKQIMELLRNWIDANQQQAFNSLRNAFINGILGENRINYSLQLILFFH